MLTRRWVYIFFAVLFAIVTVFSFRLFVTFIIQAENSPTWSGSDLYLILGLGITTFSVLATLVFALAAWRPYPPRKDT